jgi:histone H3/H4
MELDTILPQGSVLRVIKEELPEGAHISLEAKGCLSRAAAIFALHLVATASDVSRESNRRTVTTGDICRALEELDLPEFVDALRGDLTAFKDAKKAKREASRAAKLERGGGGAAGEGEGAEEGGGEEEGEEAGEGGGSGGDEEAEVAGAGGGDEAQQQRDRNLRGERVDLAGDEALE